MALDLTELKAQGARVVQEVGEIGVVVRDLASKLENTADPAEIASIAAQMKEAADGLDALAKPFEPAPPTE